MRGDQPGVAAEEGLDGNGLGRIEGRIIAGAAGGGHALGELLTGQGVVIARDPFKGRIGNRGTLDQSDGRTELAEATAVDLHPLRVVIRLPEILPQRVTEDLTRANAQHTHLRSIHPDSTKRTNENRSRESLHPSALPTTKQGRRSNSPTEPFPQNEAATRQPSDEANNSTKANASPNGP